MDMSSEALISELQRDIEVSRKSQFDAGKHSYGDKPRFINESADNVPFRQHHFGLRHRDDSSQERNGESGIGDSKSTATTSLRHFAEAVYAAQTLARLATLRQLRRDCFT
jgi:hypothetical protein